MADAPPLIARSSTPSTRLLPLSFSLSTLPLSPFSSFACSASSVGAECRTRPLAGGGTVVERVGSASTALPEAAPLASSGRTKELPEERRGGGSDCLLACSASLFAAVWNRATKDDTCRSARMSFTCRRASKTRIDAHRSLRPLDWKRPGRQRTSRAEGVTRT